MPKKIKECTKAHLISVPLPNHAASYTVISHQFVIDYAYQALANAGFGIVEEEYRSTADGQIAQGIYKLNFNNDPELSMMFAWTNSYNKQVKFKCVVGAYINTTGSVMICGDIGSWTRKHTGTADQETKDTIDHYISNAYMYYNQLVSDKTQMENVDLTLRKQAQLLGVLFAEYDVLTTEQASTVRQQMARPTVAFGNQFSLWAFYNYVTIALQQSHPRTWMEDQRMLHYFISTIVQFPKVTTPTPIIAAPVEEDDDDTVVDPLENNYGEPENQTNLLVQIAEVTGDDSVLQAQHPVTTPEGYPLKPSETIPHIDDLTDEQIIQMHSGKGLTLAHYKPTDRFEEESQLSDNQVVQEDEIWTTDEEPQKIATILDEVVSYEDPAGNTFEAPIVNIDIVDLNETTKMAVIVSEEPELAPERVKFAVDNSESDDELPFELDEIDAEQDQDDDFDFDF